MRFYAGLRPIVGERTVDLSLADGSSVQQLLDEVLRRWPALRPYLLDAEGGLSRRVHVFVDGRSVRWLEQGLATPLAAGNELAFFPPVGGGSS